jgi:hypothetical protein
VAGTPTVSGTAAREGTTLPVGRTTTRSEVKALVVVLGSLVAIVAAVVFFLTAVAENGKVQVRLGDDRFDAGRAEQMAEEVREGGPFTYSDVAGRQRDIVVNHLAQDPAAGWVAFEVRRPGDPRDCQVKWQPDAGHFSYTCDASLTFPPNGEGLEQFPVEIVSGRILVDLNAAARESTSTSSSVVISGR